MRLGNDPDPFFTSNRPVTLADLQRGPGKEALDGAGQRQGLAPAPQASGGATPVRDVPPPSAEPRPVQTPAQERPSAPVGFAGDNTGINFRPPGDDPIVPGAGRTDPGSAIVPSPTPTPAAAQAQPLGALDLSTAPNAATLARIRDASPREINEWMTSLSIDEKRALPGEVKDAILENVNRRITEAAQAPRPTTEQAVLNSPEMSRITREITKDLELGVAGQAAAGQLREYGPFRAVLFDSGNGGLAAAGVASRMLSQLTDGKTQLVTMGDHQNQPYGVKSEGEITQLVFNAVEAGAKTDPDVIAMACNTACIALFRAQENGVPVPSGGIPVVNLIDNSARAVAENPAIYGERPMILSTAATARSGLYQQLIPEYSDGRVQPYSVGGSDPAVTKADGTTEIRDLATLVNQLAHKDPARQEEVLNAARHYVNKMPQDMTSMVMCCTHYPELIPHFRQALDERGMQHVPIFDPMKDQMLTVARRLGARVEGTEPPNSIAPTGPDVVITSATGRPNPGQTPEQAARTHLDVFPSVPALTGQDSMTFSGQNFGANYDAGVVNAFLNGEISGVDAATVGFHGRNLHTFFNPGGARDAGNMLSDANSVMMMTGFNVPPNPDVPGSVPRPETDGPPGTAALAAALVNTGKEVTLVTDPLNKPVLEASLQSLGVDLNNPNLRIVEFNAKGPAADAEAQRLLDTYRPDVVGAIELPGRNVGGTRTNMGGIQIDGYNPDLDAILLAANNRAGTRTFGVGDGGNEAGVGGLDLSRVALPSPSVVGADVAVTAENSNLGAYAVAAEYLNAIGRTDLLLTPQAMQSSVEAAVQAGAVDGVSRMPTPTVDGFPFTYHERNLNHLNGAIQGTWPPGAASQRATPQP